jgi:hypothetical protein
MKKDKEKQRGKKEGEQTTCVLWFTPTQ